MRTACCPCGSLAGANTARSLTESWPNNASKLKGTTQQWAQKCSYPVSTLESHLRRYFENCTANTITQADLDAFHLAESSPKPAACTCLAYAARSSTAVPLLLFWLQLTGQLCELSMQIEQHFHAQLVVGFTPCICMQTACSSTARTGPGLLTLPRERQPRSRPLTCAMTLQAHSSSCPYREQGTGPFCE